MKIAVFTSNQPRHVALIEAMASTADEVYAVQECNTLFPGQVPDFFRRSEVMQRYFSRVIAAEAEVFGRPRFAPRNVIALPMKMGDLNRLEMDALRPALSSDLYVVFGASFIRGGLCEHLVAQKALNIHMGVSPYYRGSSCNFWAMYDGRPDYVGATIHRLSSGLDSGPMLLHALPAAEPADPFVVGMKAVKAAHKALVQLIQSGGLGQMEPVRQDRALELHYTRNADFTDEVAQQYLDRLPLAKDMEAALRRRDMSRFLNPYVG